MGRVIKNKIKGMTWWAKAGLVSLVTLATTMFMYEGWYQPRNVQAAISSVTAWTFINDTNPNTLTPNVTSASTYTAGGTSGTGRIMLIAVSFSTTATGVTMTGTNNSITATYGGISATKVIGGDDGTTAGRGIVWLGYIKDANIPSGAKNVVVTGTVTGTNVADVKIACATFSGVDQNTPFTDSKWSQTTTAATTGTAVSLNYNAGDYPVIFANNNVASSTASTTYTPAKYTSAANSSTTLGGAVAARITTLPAANVTGESTNVTMTSGRIGLIAASLKVQNIVNPTVTGASPALQQGTSGTVTVTGTGFQSGATVAISGTGVTPGTATFVSGTTLTVPVTVAANAAQGNRNVTVTNPDTGSGTGTGVFTVNAAPAPTVTATNPPNMIQGAGPTTVTITGTNFLSGSTVSFSGTGISLGSVTYVDPTTLTVPVTIAAGATLGARNVTVTLPGGQSGTGTGVFNVDSPCITGAPTSLTHGAETSTSVPLAWTGGASTDYFNVYRDGVKISTDGAVTTGSYTDTTASPGSSYVYTVKGYNTGASCESAASNSTTAVTLATTPAAPAVSNVGNGTSLNVSVNADGNSAATSYAIRINGGAYTNQYIQSGGTIGGAAAWFTRAGWGTTTISGVTNGQNYTFDVKARNAESIETGFGSTTVGNPHPALSSSITTCNACHGNPPIDNASRVGGTTGQFPGSHNKHAGSGAGQYGFACTKCHVNNTGVLNHANGAINMANPINGNAGAGYTRGNAPPVANSFNPGYCTNTYCHSNGTSVSTGTIPNNTSVAWGDTAGCTSCHGVGGSTGAPTYKSGVPKMNSHTSARAHKTATCDICHSSVTYSGGVYTRDVAHHNDGNYDLKGTLGYVFASTGGSCSTPGNGCHGPTPGTWGGKLRCVDCHNKTITRTKGRTGAVLANAVSEFGLAWGHKKSGRQLVADDDCIVCHLEGDGTTHKPSAYHQDGNIDLRDPWGAGETPITNMSNGAFTFSRFSTSFAAGSRSSTLNNSNIAQVITLRFCVRCHSKQGATNPTARSNNGGSGTANMPFGGIPLGANYTVLNGASVAGGVVNVFSQFSTGNSSVHPIRGPRVKDYPTAARLLDPYKPTGTRGTGGTKTAGIILNCFDCHNAPTSPLTRRTTVAHGNAATIRGNVYTNPYTLCQVCHTGYTVADNHGTGSAMAMSTGRSGEGFNSGCYSCHGDSGDTDAGTTPTTVRPARGQGYHGFNTLLNGSAKWPSASGGRPYAFIRNTQTFAGTTGYHRPKGGMGELPNTGSATCMGGSGCAGNGSAEPYTPGGQY
jgi:trimeric autotransporter adhesin